MIEFNNIKVLIFDLDGTLTDGIYQISELGIVTKYFYTRDFDAIGKMMRAGFAVSIVTQAHDEVVYRQIDRIAEDSKFWKKSLRSGVLDIYTAVESKEKVIEEQILKPNNWGWDVVAYMGDAENDIGCMEKALFTGCPADAIFSVREDVNYMSNFPGGKGAVYDFCQYIKDKVDNL